MTRPAHPVADADDLRLLVGPGRLPGADHDALAAALGRRHPPAIRLRREADRQRLPWPLEPVPWYRLAGWPEQQTPRPSRTLAYAAGDYYLQDAGSLLALAATDADADPAPAAALRVCDLCSSPGGKASALVEAAGPGGFVVANEPIRGRLPPLAFNLTRTGSDRFAITSLDPERLAAELPGMFDLVVVDAPCSGQALLGRGKQRPSALSARQVDLNAARQRRILTAAVTLLRPGGRLIYSTCTFAEAENEHQVAWLIDRFGLEAAPVARLARQQSDSALPAYRLWPHRDRCAGAFAAALRAPAAAGAPPGDAEPDRRRDRPAARPNAECQKLLRSLGCATGGVEFGVAGSVVIGWPADIPPRVRSLAAAGPEWLHRTGTTWRPANALAVRRDDRVAGMPAVTASDAEAAAFLRGEPLPLPPGDETWLRVTWQGRGLGWVKRDRGLGKNHLPPAARLAVEG